MARLAAAMVAAFVCLVRPAAAQGPWPPASQQLTIAAGLAVNSRVDEVVSPLQFGGRGAGVFVAYARASGRYALTASLAGSAPMLAPLSDSPAEPREQLTSGELQASLLRASGNAPADGRGLAFGGSFGASVAMTSHHYDDPRASSATFLTALGTLGPAVSWSHLLAGGLARIELSAPVVSLVMRSYSDIKLQHTTPEFRVVTPSALRGVYGTVAYSPPAERRMGVSYRYAFGVMRYDDRQPLRSVSQSFSVGIATRIGRLGP